ncbi:STAS domain-containing protein [Streptomyces sp. NPDC006274]|uniref:STAS domain-containing protein n=1 Tax=unclassified Streptomyces TaxID=2593676 RepID=UPI0033A80582
MTSISPTETPSGRSSVSVAPAGELGLDTVAGIEPTLTRLAQDTERGTTLDLTDVTFCDSSGVVLFFRMHQHCLAAGAHWSLSGIQRPTARVIRAPGMDRTLSCSFA